MDKTFKHEQEKLRSSKIQIKEVKEQTEVSLQRLSKERAYEPRLLANLIATTSLRLRNLEKSEDKPYFARIDFKENGKEKKEELYIGKVGVIDSDSKILVTDWRAPISSIYYDGYLGDVEYEAPIGTIKGNLSLKRQIVIENGELESIFDVDSVSDDELLKPYLGSNADSRLKNIVASIQTEQNNIIRAILNKNLIVQGVAGSGKTTVALHRIAYLIYNYDKKFKPDQFMVVGPNKFFIKYISNVLPDLDVGNAKQLTFDELAMEYIEENFTLSDSSGSLIDLVNGHNPSEILSYKMSMKYKEDLDKFIKEFELSLIPEVGIQINGFTIFSKQQILDTLKSYSKSTNIQARFTNVMQRLKSQIQNDATLYDRISNHFKDKWNGSSAQDNREVIEQEMAVKTEFKTNFDKALKKVFNIKSKKVITLYKTFISNVHSYVSDNDMASEIKSVTSKKFAKKQFDFEDVSALMYIKYSLFGEGDYKNFAHIVVDEAQDLGEFNFYMLKLILSSSTFSIFGDLTQGIYSYRGIKKWQQVQDKVFDSKCEIMKLEKSYRTTVEIMLAANLISSHLNLGEGKPVIRYGESVKLTKVDNSKKVEYLQDKLNELVNKNMKSIAVICKTPKECEELYSKMKQSNINITVITEDNTEYNDGICILPAYLSKGLEFDSVIVYNVNSDEYDVNNDIDMKLLYVAMTRALHSLELLYDLNPVNILLKI